MYRKVHKVKDGVVKTVGRPVEATSDWFGPKDAMKYAEGHDFDSDEDTEENVSVSELVGTTKKGIGVHYNGDRDHYYFTRGVKDSCGGKSKKPVKPVGKGKGKVKDSFSDIDFFITEDNVYDLIHEGTTSVAIPSGVDTKAFVAAVEDIIKDVAKDCGYKGLKLSTEIVGNMLNIFNNK